MKIHNCFDFEVKNTSGEVIRTAHAENIVLNQYINRIVNGNSCFNAIHVGAGTEEPAVSDTQLTEYITGRTADLSGVSIDWDNLIFAARKSIVFQADELVNQTLTEVGVAYNASNGSLCTHALIRDENGNVSSITKSDTEILTIHATVYADLSAVEKNGMYIQRYINTSETLSTNRLPVAARWALGISAGYTTGYCMAYDVSNPQSGYSGSTSASGNTRKITYPDITVSQYNDMAIKIINIGGDSGLCMKVPNSGFPQPKITNEILGTGDGSTTEYNTKFSFITDATVKVDGVAVTGVTINKELPQQVQQCFELYDYPRTYNSDEEKCVAPIPLFVDYDSVSEIAGAWAIYENIYCSKGVKIRKCVFSRAIVSLSNDLTTWTPITSNQTIPEDMQSAKYWKVEKTSTLDYQGLSKIEWTRPSDIIFAEPPAEGTEITVDYLPDCIAKDANHILRGIEFDITFNG